METEKINEIIESIKQQIKTNAEKNNIDPKQLQFIIEKRQGFSIEGPISCKMFSCDKFVANAKISEMFNISLLKMPIVNAHLLEMLTKLANKNGINDITANARIFTQTDDNYPCVDLYNSDVFIKKISIEELLN